MHSVELSGWWSVELSVCAIAGVICCCRWVSEVFLWCPVYALVDARCMRGGMMRER